MRNDARPIGEEFRDIAEHHKPAPRRAPERHEVQECIKGSDPAEGSRDAVNLDPAPPSRERVNQPPPEDRSDR